MSYAVYALFDPRNIETVRYIGFSRKPESRVRHHISVAKKGKGHTNKCNWLKELVAENIFPGWRALAMVETMNDAALLEREFIKEYKENGHPLTNETSGGDGNFDRTDERREHQRRVMIEYWASPAGKAHREIMIETCKRVQTGLKRTDEAKAKMRVAKLGKPHARQRTPEWNAKIAAAQAGKKRRPWTEEERARHAAGQNHEKMSESAKARNVREQETNCINQRKKSDQFQNLPSQQEWMANPAK